MKWIKTYNSGSSENAMAYFVQVQFGKFVIRLIYGTINLQYTMAVMGKH